MRNNKCFITMLIILMILGAGCAGTTGNSTPAYPNEQEQVASNSSETPETEIALQETEYSGEKLETGTENDQSVDQTEAESIGSDIVKPMNDNNPGEQVKLLVTRDFGSQVILQESVPIQNNWTVVDVLKAEMKVETRYGGGFIDSINGLKSLGSGLNSEPQDWFYYVNGICPDVGGGDYPINHDEVIWWDYHIWKAGFTNSAVIGCYPEPFLHGYDGEVRSTTIMCPDDDLETGKLLEKSLKERGVNNIKVVKIDEGILNSRQGPVIVLGEWAELNHSTYLKDLNQTYKRNGTGIHFNEQGLDITNIQGQVERSFDGSTGVIAAAGGGLGDPCPLWLVSGTDGQGFQHALDILLNYPGKISGRYNAVITAGEVISVPVY